MALTKQDREFISSSIQLGVATMKDVIVEQRIEPLEDDAIRVKTTLFGATGANGLNSDIKEVKRSIRLLRWYVAIGLGIVITVSAVAPYILHQLGG